MKLSQARNFLHHSVKRISVFAVVLAASALAAQAQVVFSPPKNISNSSGGTQAQQIAVDAKGNINVVWLDNSPGSYAVFFSRSSDAGVTFSTPVNVSNHPGSRLFGPGMAVGPDGNIFIIWFDNSSGGSFTYSVFFSRSTDGGSTFSAPQVISNAGADARPGQMIVDSSGSIDVVWVDNSPGNYALFFRHSTDGGASFSTPVNLSNNTNASSFNSNAKIAVDSSGNIDVMWGDQGGTYPIEYTDLLFSRSVDGGTTFSSPYAVDRQTGNPNDPPGVFVPEMTVDASNNIDLLWSRSFFNGDWFDEDVVFSSSKDGGATFSTPVEINGISGGDRSLQMAIGPGGDVNVVYYTNPFYPSFPSSGETDSLARSVDGGATFASAWQTDSCGGASGAQIGVDGSDKIDVVYDFGSGTNCSTSTSGLFFTQSSDGSSFSTPEKLSDGVSPIMAIDSSGNVYVTSQLSSNGKNDIFFSRSVALSSVTLSPADVTGGGSPTGTVTMNGPAPTGGALVSLSSSDSSVSVPATVTIQEGTTSTTFTVVTSPVAAKTTAIIMAAFGGVTQTATITVEPPVLTSLTLNPASTTGGSSSTGTVTLSGPAPSGGAVVALANSNTSVANVPSSVTVPAGFSNATFTVNTRLLLCPNSATITASLGAVSQTANLAVMPFVNLPPQACSAIGAHGPTRIGKL